MSKKQDRSKSRRTTKRVKRLHYFYVLVPVVALAALVTYVLLPMKNSGVLSERTHVARSGPAEGTADGGRVEIKGPNKKHETKVRIEASKGEQIEIDDESGASGSGNRKGRMKHILEKALKRAEQRERKVERKENKEIRKELKDLTVLTEDGEVVKLEKSRKEKLLILPEKAVAALLRNGHLQVVASRSASASSSGAPVVVYTRTNGKPVYIVAGSKEEKLFGAFPVNLEKTVTMSAETGEVVTTEQSVVTRILDLFSF